MLSICFFTVVVTNKLVFSSVVAYPLMATSSSTETPQEYTPEYSRLDELAMEWEPESNSHHFDVGALCVLTREESLFIPPGTIVYPQTDDQEALKKEMMEPEMEPTNKTPSKPGGNEILWTVRKRDSRIVPYNNKCILEAVDRAYFSHMGTHAPQYFLLKLLAFVEQYVLSSHQLQRWRLLKQNLLRDEEKESLTELSNTEIRQGILFNPQDFWRVPHLRTEAFQRMANSTTSPPWGGVPSRIRATKPGWRALEDSSYEAEA